VDAVQASGNDLRTIQSGERRKAPRKDAAIREHETPGASAFRVHGSRCPSVGLPSAAFGSPLAEL